jgi:ferritin
VLDELFGLTEAGRSTSGKNYRRDPGTLFRHSVNYFPERVTTNLKSRERKVLISRELAEAFNGQIGNEFGASMQYLSIAAYFQERHLTLLCKLFTEQAAEEKEHAMKFVRYLMDTKGGLAIPAIPAPKPGFSSAEAAVQAALDWEKEVTRQITALMDLAVGENDYLAQSFLQWFIDEQLEEVVKMDRLLGVIRQSGEKNLLMVEAYLVHIEKS